MYGGVWMPTFVRPRTFVANSIAYLSGRVLLVFLQTPLYGTSDHLRCNSGGEGDCAGHKQNSRFQSPPFLLCEIIVSDYADLQIYSGIRKYHSWAKHILFQNWALSTRFRRCMSFANSAGVEVEFCSDAFLETSD